MTTATNHPTDATNPDAGLSTLQPPETHQQAGAWGAELHRFFSVRYRGLISVRETGEILLKTVDADWKVLARRRPEIPIDAWRAHRARKFEALPAWQREVDELPTMDELAEAVSDGVCDTPTGHRVEPDGAGPDGVPSWIELLLT